MATKKTVSVKKAEQKPAPIKITILRDLTEHNPELDHLSERATHSPEWYAMWGNRCPTCGVPSRHQAEEMLA